MPISFFSRNKSSDEQQAPKKTPEPKKAPEPKKQKIKAEYFRNKVERKKQYIDAEKYVRKAVVRRGLDNAYAIRENEIRLADQAVRASGATYATTKFDDTGIAKKIGIKGLDVMVAHQDTVQAAENLVEEQSLTNFLDMAHTSLKSSKTAMARVMTGIDSVSTIAGMGVAKQSLGGATAIISTAEGIKNTALAVKSFKTASQINAYGEEIKQASGKYDLSQPYTTLREIGQEQAEANEELHRVEKVKSSWENNIMWSPPEMRPSMQSTLRLQENYIQQCKENLLMMQDVSNIFMANWNALRMVESAKDVKTQEGTSKSIAALGNVLDVAGGVATATGIGASVGMIFTVGSLIITGINVAFNYMMNKERAKSIVRQETGVRTSLQGQALKASAFHSGERVLAGQHQGRFADRMMGNLSANKLVQDIIDEVYTEMGQKEEYEELLRVTSDSKDEEKKKHGRMVTKSYENMIFYEMGAVSGDTDGLSDTIQAKKSINLLIKAGAERERIYPIRDFNRQQRSKATPSYSVFPAKAQPTVEFLERTAVKQKKDDLTPEKSIVEPLPNLNETSKGFGSNTSSVSNLVKNTEGNPFVEKWKLYIMENGDGGAISEGFNGIVRGTGNAWSGFTGLFAGKQKRKERKAAEKVEEKRHARIDARESRRIDEEREEMKAEIDRNNLAKRQRLAGMYGAQVALGTRDMGNFEEVTKEAREVRRA
ncbi:MAG: hypothetical protein R3Y24_12280 [Eubacteriales bacterium]